jgi:hypothetical protein
LDHGKADLLSIGEWLAALDLSPADTARDALKIMLGRFDSFQLPKFTGFPLGRKRTTLSPYIEKANAFFAYTMFLDAKERDKATKAIDKMLAAITAGEDTGVRFEDQDVLGPYANAQSFLSGLKNYILTEDREDRERLKQCDFVTIVDKILKFRTKTEEKEKKDSLHKLSGGPVEVILHAVWQTFREFGRDKRFPDAEVQRIEIVADRFKHDYENADNSEEIDATADRTESARKYLLRLLGGVDEQLGRG